MRLIIFTVIFFFQSAILFAEPVRIGTTFSRVQCDYLGIDWEAAYLWTLEKGFDLIRVAAYWEMIEKKENEYDFSSLDWQIAKAREKGVPVILAVGLKAPRWPEYFIPGWVLKQTPLHFWATISKRENVRAHTLDFIKEVVTRYRNESTIWYWQVENESLDRFGKDRWIISKSFLKEEVDLVRELDDKKRPVILTVATFPNKYLRFIMSLIIPHDPIRESLKLGDIIGINVYPVVGTSFFGINCYFCTGESQRYRYFKHLLNLAEKQNKKIWVTELQAEPWEPGALVYKGEKEPPTGRPEDTKKCLEELKALGIRTFLLWGAEYWYYRKIKFGDTAWEKETVDILKKR